MLAKIESFDPSKPFSPLSSLYVVEAFIRTLARELKGQNDPNGKITVTTMLKSWQEFKFCIDQDTGSRFPGELCRRLDKASNTPNCLHIATLLMTFR